MNELSRPGTEIRRGRAEPRSLGVTEESFSNVCFEIATLLRQMNPHSESGLPCAMPNTSYSSHPCLKNPPCCLPYPHSRMYVVEERTLEPVKSWQIKAPNGAIAQVCKSPEFWVPWRRSVCNRFGLRLGGLQLHGEGQT